MSLVSVVFGTRPEAIKLAPVVLRLRRDEALRCEVCVTGQHREMLDQVNRAFGIVPDVDLDLMRPDQRLAQLTAAAVGAVDAYLERSRPDLVLVQGDTTTAFCAALAAFYRRIPVGHVEAGLRTGDLDAPWPEEANRALTARIARLHFAPTAAARDNLLREAVPPERVHVTGNTVVDALSIARRRVRREPPALPGLEDVMDPAGERPVLVTCHRRESFGVDLEGICLALRRLAEAHPAVPFVYPVHPNPRVRQPVLRLLSGLPNVRLVEPLGYGEMIALMERCRLILTDSGGIQEEAPSFGKPTLVMRTATERQEAVDAGFAELVGTDADAIVAAASPWLAEPRRSLAAAENPFGDGRASERIVRLCGELLAEGR